MRKPIVFLFLSFSGLLVSGLAAQQTLTLNEAIAIALKNNYDIRIADLNLAIDVNNDHPGTAGLLPRVDFSLSGSAFKSQSPAAFITSRLNTGSGINVGWTVFDGFRAVANQERLGLLVDQSQGNAAVIVETTIQAVMLAYNNALVAKEQGRVLKQVLTSSKRRLTYEEFRKEIGTSGTFELLQFRDAVLTDSTNVLTQQLNLRNALRNLNLLMNTAVETEWELTDPLRENFPDYRYEDLLNKMLASNKTLQNQYVFNKILKEDTRIARADLYPTIDLSGSTSFGLGTANRIDGNSVDFSAFDFSAGLSLSFNLYNGGNTRRAIENARINERIGDLQEKQLKDVLSNDLQVAYDSYRVRKDLLRLQEARADNAQTNLEIAEDRFKNGLINSLDFRTIQLQFLNAQFNLLSALRDIKESETELIRLTGGLIREE